MSDKKIKTIVSESELEVDEEMAQDVSYPEEDLEVLINTFGKGANKRKMLVTKGITLKQLYNLSKD